MAFDFETGSITIQIWGDGVTLTQIRRYLIKVHIGKCIITEKLKY